MKTIYRNCTLLDGVSGEMKPQPGMAVVVEDDRITAVLPDAEAGSDGAQVALDGRYLMPGLINLHIHLPAGGKPKKKPTDAKKLSRILMSTALTRLAARTLCESYAKTELLSGCTTVRTVGGVRDIDSQVRDRVNAGLIPGPRMLVSNMAISVPGGHMAGSLAYEAQSADDARSLVRKIAQDKPDLVKLMITGGVLDATERGEPGVLRMPPEYVAAACEEAHRLGFLVAAHVESPEGVRAALENGVDTVEHGAKMDAESIRQFKTRGAKLVTTISPALPYAMFDRSVSCCSELAQYNGRIVMDGIISCAKDALANDIPVGLGTDTGCPFITHYDMWRELNYFRKYCGVTPAFALYTATRRNAEIAGISDETGSIEPGKAADFIVCDSDPLADLSALRQLYLVVARGRAYPHPQIKKYPQVERELDRWL